jgi:hypothetical protein
MHRLRLSLPGLLALAFAGALFAAAPSAHADIYSISALTGDNKSFYGMDDAGSVVFTSSGGTYFTYLNGSFSGSSSTAPALAYDFGSGPCHSGSTPVCTASDNGRTVKAYSEFGTPFDDLFLYSQGNTQWVTQTQGIAGLLAINGLGDIVFDNGTADEWYEAVDLTAAQTPEPSALLLLATGAFAIAAFAIRRRFAA